jgi:hypothetical protein
MNGAVPRPLRVDGISGSVATPDPSVAIEATMVRFAKRTSRSSFSPEAALFSASHKCKENDTTPATASASAIVMYATCLAFML